MKKTGEVVAFLLLAAVLFVTWPQTLGGRVAYIMVSGHSMEPTMHTGDLAVMHAESSYHVGEIIAYRVPAGKVGAGVPVIHRIIGGNARTGFVTRGDHNPYDDPWRPHLRDIVGTRRAVIPGAVATAFTHLRGPLPLGIFAGLLTVVASFEVLKRRPHRPPVPQPI